MRVYISGPMSNYKDLNFPAFDAAKALLLAEGHEVVSPVDLERERDDRSYEEKLRDDCKYLLDCDAIYMLKGWNASTGACLEKFIAQTLGMREIYEPGAFRFRLTVGSRHA